MGEEKDGRTDMLIALADEDKDRAKVKRFVKDLPIFSTGTEDKTTELIALADQDSAAVEQTTNSLAKEKTTKKKVADKLSKMTRFRLQSHHHHHSDESESTQKSLETSTKEIFIKNRDAGHMASLKKAPGMNAAKTYEHRGKGQ